MLAHLLDGVGDDGAATGLEAAVFAVEFFDFFIDPVAELAVHADGEFDDFFGAAHAGKVIPSVQKSKRYENFFWPAAPLLKRMSSEIFMG